MKADTSIDDDRLVVTLPDDTLPGSYTLMTRADVPATIIQCPVEHCAAWSAARFFAHVEVPVP